MLGQIALGPQFQNFTFKCCFLTCHRASEAHVTINWAQNNLFGACAEEGMSSLIFLKVKMKRNSKICLSCVVCTVYMCTTVYRLHICGCTVYMSTVHCVLLLQENMYVPTIPPLQLYIYVYCIYVYCIYMCTVYMCTVYMCTVHCVLLC